MTSKNVDKLTKLVEEGELDANDLFRLVELKEISADMFIEIMYKAKIQEDE